jgi:autotransporter-associated beta strand protein
MATWIGTGLGAWNLASNWQGGVLPNSQTAAIISTGNALVSVPNAAASQVSLSGNRLLIVEAPVGGQGSLTVGGRVDVAAGSDLIVRNEGVVNAIELLIAGRLVFGQSSAGAPQSRAGDVGGVVNLTPTGSVYFNHIGSSTFSQIIAGSGSVELAGGSTTLAGDNSYTGATTVNSILTIQSGTALGSVVGGTVVNGALYMRGGIAVGAEALTLNGNGGLRNTADTNTYGGLITLGTNSRIHSDAGSLTLTNNINNGGHLLSISGDGQIQIAGSISGAGSLQKTGSGNLVFSGNNTWTGTASIEDGSLTLASNAVFSGAVVLSDDADLDLSGSATIGSLAANTSLGTVVDLGANTLTLGDNNNSTQFTGLITGSGGITKQGSGTFTLKDNINSYMGTTTINAGAINIQSGSALGSIAGGTVVAAGAALQLQGGITVGAEALILNGSGIGNTGALRNLANANTYEGAITLGSASRINSDAAFLTLNNTITTVGNRLTFGGNGQIDVNGVVSGTGGLTKDGLGTLVLAGANAWTGTADIATGVLTLGHNSAFSGAVLVAESALLNLEASASIGSLADGIGNGNSVVSLGSNTLTLGSDNSTTQYGGVITGTGGLTKVGTGKLTLDRDSPYTGKTTVDGGELALISGGVVGVGSTEISIGANGTLSALGDRAFSSAAVITNRGNLVVGALQEIARLSGNGNVNINSGSTLSLGNGLSIIDGTISGSGNLQIVSSTAVLTTDHSHTGEVYVIGGTLGLSGGGSIENSAKLTLVDGGVLDVGAIFTSETLQDFNVQNGGTIRLLGKSLHINNIKSDISGTMTIVGGSGDDELRFNLAQNLQNFSLANALFVDWADAADVIIISAQAQPGDQDNEITGSSQSDQIAGGQGQDSLFGGAGNDLLNGGTENDNLHGGAGNDLLLGASGDDILHADAGIDTLDGGSGRDTADFSAATTVVIAHLDTPAQYAQWGSGVGGTLEQDVLIGIENLVGGAGDDYLYGNSVANFLHGGGGNDYIEAGDGDDTILGQAGRDFIDASYGLDFVQGGDEVGPGDIIYGGAGDDLLFGEGGDDFLYGGHGADTLRGGDGTDVLFVDLADILLNSLDGGAGIDYIVWQDVDNAANLDISFYSVDYFYGYNGNDFVYSSNALLRPELHGGNGDDVLTGSFGVGSILLGEGDNDRLISDSGIDHMVGGAGADTFVFTLGGGIDYIYDFKTGGADKIDFVALSSIAVHSLANLTVITSYSDSGWYGYQYSLGVNTNTVWVNTNGIGATQPVASDFLFA